MKTKRLNGAAALEASIESESILDALRAFPALYSNGEVMLLLADIDKRLQKEMGCVEDANEEGYSDGERQGYRNAIDEWFPQIEHAALALIQCVNSDDAELRAEIPEAVEDLKKELESMQSCIS